MAKTNQKPAASAGLSPLMATLVVSLGLLGHQLTALEAAVAAKQQATATRITPSTATATTAGTTTNNNSNQGKRQADSYEPSAAAVGQEIGGQEASAAAALATSGGEASLNGLGDSIMAELGHALAEDNSNNNNNNKEVKPANKGGLFELAELGKLGDWVKLMFNPLELAKAVAVHFKLDVDRFLAVVGKGALTGIEALLTPLVVTSRFVEKVFVPDACRLKLLCKMGAHLEFIKVHVLKFSAKFLEGSSHLKAFTDGIVGRDCETAFASCAPGDGLKLKKAIEEQAGRR